MGQHLVFRLSAPLASWGGVATGTTRGTDAVPSRSALLGLLSAALGIRREQQSDLTSLARSVAFAVRVDREGEILPDYHTVASASEKALKDFGKAGVTPRTRKEEVEASLKAVSGSAIGETVILTTRWYRMDASYTVAVHLHGAATVTLEELQEALRKPQLVLYLGRKSCPVGWPLAPELVEGADVVEAMRAFDNMDQACTKAAGLEELSALAVAPPRKTQRGRAKGRLLAWEEGVPVPSGLGSVQEAKRFDEPVHRLRWQFTQRKELRTMWPEVQ